MKNFISLFLVLFTLTVLMTSCSSDTTSSTAQNDSTEEQTSSVESTPSKENTDTQDTDQESVSNDDVDIDLTALNSLLVYAEVTNITESYEDYLGKTIKFSGLYLPYYYEETGNYYHYVLVADTAACCSGGFEFIWTGEHSYPEDYPKENQEIEITGVLKNYTELGEVFYYLEIDAIVIL